MLNNRRDGFAGRINVVAGRGYFGEQRLFALLELFCFWASFVTLLGLLPLTIFARQAAVALPAWGIPALGVLLAAAIGYLTNYIALEMLFKPYRRTWFHPLSLLSFGYWRQGLVPRNKDRIGVELGRQIEEKLLDPEALADEMCDLAGQILRDPAVTGQVREKVCALLADKERQVMEFLIPRIEQSLAQALETLLTPEQVGAFFETQLYPVIGSSSARSVAAGHIVEVLRRRSGELTVMLKTELHQMALEYLRRKLPMGVGAESLAQGLTQCLDWDAVEKRLYDKLGDESVKALLQDELLVQMEHLRETLAQGEGRARLDEFLAGLKRAVGDFLHGYLRENLPQLAMQAVASDSLWQWVEQELLPAAQPQLENLIRNCGKERIVARLDLARRVAGAVANQEVEEFHRMINSIAAEHLGAIQVLGYILGGIVGVLQLFL